MQENIKTPKGGWSDTCHSDTHYENDHIDNHTDSHPDCAHSNELIGETTE